MNKTLTSMVFASILLTGCESETKMANNSGVSVSTEPSKIAEGRYSMNYTDLTGFKPLEGEAMKPKNVPEMLYYQPQGSFTERNCVVKVR